MNKIAIALLSAAACLSITLCADPASAGKMGSPSIQSTDPVVNAVNAVRGGPCWRACWQKKTDCPYPWTARRLGNCWTCCRAR